MKRQYCYESALPIKDPTGRYEKSTKIIFSRKRAVVFHAYDTVTGNTVNWVELHLEGLSKPVVVDALKQIDSIKGISHPNFISLTTYWKEDNSSVIYLITDSTTCDSLQDLVYSPYFSLNARVMKRWFSSIVDALCYLQMTSRFHGHLSISEIFVKSNTGALKLCPPLSKLSAKPNNRISYDTPPERLYNIRDVQSDVWMLGMIVLESLTHEKPYAECETPNDLMAKLSKGIPPKSMEKVLDPMAIDFLNQCFLPHALRPLPVDLAKHPFLQITKRHKSGHVDLHFFMKKSQSVSPGRIIHVQFETSKSFDDVDVDVDSTSNSLPDLSIALM